jgi:hypothetical protein
MISLPLYSEYEKELRDDFLDLIDRCPIPREYRPYNSALFIRRQILSRYLFADEIYKQIINVPGSIMVFGVMWGQDMALFESLHGIYEPFNYLRKIIGFDVSNEDGANWVAGDYSTPPGYEDYLARVLEYHEQEAPIPHLRRFELVKGDVNDTLEMYLFEHPETIVALAYIDIDLYAPTKHILNLIIRRIPKGGIMVFDELNMREFPGETVAVSETLGLNNCRLRRSMFHPTASYVVVGE